MTTGSHPWRPEHLHAGHDVSRFHCGDLALDTWLVRDAMGWQARDLGRTWVWADSDARVVGYFTLAAHVLTADSLSINQRRGMPRQIPGLLLGRLALDASLHGRGLGTALLVDALELVAQAHVRVGARLVVVDATSEARARWYEQYGFVRTPYLHGAQIRLVARIADVAAAFDLAAGDRLGGRPHEGLEK